MQRCETIQDSMRRIMFIPMAQLVNTTRHVVNINLASGSVCDFQKQMTMDIYIYISIYMQEAHTTTCE